MYNHEKGKYMFSVMVMVWAELEIICYIERETQRERRERDQSIIFSVLVKLQIVHFQ
jgi:hypothetical protein